MCASVKKVSSLNRRRGDLSLEKLRFLHLFLSLPCTFPCRPVSPRACLRVPPTFARISIVPSTSRATRPWYGTHVNTCIGRPPSRSRVVQQQPTPPPVRASPSHRDLSHLRARLCPTSSATTNKPRTQKRSPRHNEDPVLRSPSVSNRTSARAAVETKRETFQTRQADGATAASFLNCDTATSRSNTRFLCRWIAPSNCVDGDRRRGRLAPRRLSIRCEPGTVPHASRAMQLTARQGAGEGEASHWNTPDQEPDLSSSPPSSPGFAPKGRPTVRSRFRSKAPPPLDVGIPEGTPLSRLKSKYSVSAS